MSGLMINLRSGEKFLINGALLINGNKRAQISIPNSNVQVLRLSDAIYPDDAKTPVTRLYYAVQLIVSCDQTVDECAAKIRDGLNALLHVFEGTQYEKVCQKCKTHFEERKYYSVLCHLKSLFEIEAAIFAKQNYNFTEPNLAYIAAE